MKKVEKERWGIGKENWKKMQKESWEIGKESWERTYLLFFLLMQILQRKFASLRCK